MKKPILSIFFALNLLLCFGQPGANDPSFNSTDIGNGFGDWFNGQVASVVIQPGDGKFIAAGHFKSYNGTTANGIIRLATDGSVDESFNAGTGFNSGVSCAALQPDGKIVAGGSFTSYNGTPRNFIARLNADGTLDASFTPVSLSGPVGCMAIQPDGKIIIGGVFYTDIKYIARLNSDGSLDNTFSIGSGLTNTAGSSVGVDDLALQADGKIIITGMFKTVNDVNRNYIARLLSNGTVDASFDPGTGFDQFRNSMAVKVQSDGNIVVGGGFTSYNGTSVEPLVRLTPAGIIDNSFSVPVIDGIVNTVAIQADGKVLAGGTFYCDNYSKRNIARLDDDGALDASFNPGIGINGYVDALTLQADGKLLVAGGFGEIGNKRRGNLARLNTDGTPDNSIFDAPGTGFNSNRNFGAYPIAILQDGKILTGGSFTTFNGADRSGMVRMSADGAIDLSFDPGLGIGGYFPSVKAMAVQSDGKIIIGGYFYTYDGTNKNSLARLNDNGSLDVTFTTDLGFSSYANAVVLQEDGKILVGGIFTTVNDAPFNNIVRLKTDGSVDASFDPGTGLDGNVQALALQPDGKIIVAGRFTTSNGVARNRIARLNTDGSLDNTFNPGTGFNNDVYALFIQPDGKILAGGNFSAFNGVGRSMITRLNSDGTLDATFDPGTGFNVSSSNNVSAIMLQPDGKILVSGAFSTYNGVSQNGLVRLNTDGSRDASFNIGSGFNGAVIGFAIQADGKIVATGTFTNFNGTGRNRIARILGGGLKTTFNKTEVCAGESVAVHFTVTGPYNFSAGNVFTARLSDASGSFDAPISIGTLAATGNGVITAVIPNNIPAGTGYRIRVTSDQAVITGDDNGSDIRIDKVSLTISGKTNICHGDTTTLTAGGADVLLWLNGPSIPVWTIWPSETNTYTLSGSDLTTGCYATLSQVVTVKERPTISIGGAATICEGASIKLTASGASTYNWSNGVTSADNTVSPSATTSYSVTGTATNGCPGKTTATVVVNARPAKPEVTENFSNPVEPVLTASEATGYQWYKNSIEIEGATSKTFIASSFGTYTVVVSNANGCPSVPSDGRLIMITSLGDEIGIESRCFPNPTASQLHIRLNGFRKDKDIRLTIYDIQGKTEAQHMIDGSVEEFQVDVSHYPSGNYYLLFQQETRSVSQKFIKTMR